MIRIPGEHLEWELIDDKDEILVSDFKELLISFYKV